MKHSASFLAGRLALIFFSPRKRVVPRRLPITSWQTHLWTKPIRGVMGTRDARKGLDLQPAVASLQEESTARNSTGSFPLNGLRFGSES